MRATPLSLICAATLALGCGSSQGPSPFEADGTWAGHATITGGSFTLLITLADDGQTITGTGGISGSGPMCGLDIVGTRQGTKLSLQLKCPAFDPFDFTGTETSTDRIEGTFSGSGVPPTKVALKRQA